MFNNLDNDNEWACRGCDGLGAGTTPWHQLCAVCLAHLAAQGLEPAPDWMDLPETPCACCGKALILVMPAGGADACPEIGEAICDDG